ncbi:MAG: aminopeptidase, partial [Bythopirellula sp.]
VHYSANSNELFHIPAEIWRRNSQRVDKLFVTDKEIVRFELDPRRETADTEESNNDWPPKLVPSRFKLFKSTKKKNPMQKANDDAEEKKNGRGKTDEAEAEKDEAREKSD